MGSAYVDAYAYDRGYEKNRRHADFLRGPNHSGAGWPKQRKSAELRRGGAVAKGVGE